MIFMLDTANLTEIERLMNIYPIDGVTTNPTIIAKEGKPLPEIIREIRKCIGNKKMLHVQTLSETAEEIVKEALTLRDLVEGNFYAKIPVTPQGVKAMKLLKEQGLNITATAIFTQQQALIAAKVGADFVAPYVNRLDNISSHGISVVADLMQLIKLYDLKTQVLAASFKNVDQIHRVSLTGAHAATISPELFDFMMYHPLTESSVKEFIEDGKPYYTFQNE